MVGSLPYVIERYKGKHQLIALFRLQTGNAVDFYLLAICSSQILSLPLWQEGGVSDISLSQGRGAGSERSEAPLLLSVDAWSFRLLS